MWNETDIFLCNWSYTTTSPRGLDCSDVLLARATDEARTGPSARGVGGGGAMYDRVDTQLLRHITAVLYCVTFVFGLLGNTLTIIGIAINNRMKTVANCFMLNLALADDLFMISLPFMAYSTVARNWPFGAVPCKVLSVMHGVNCYASIFTMTAMSVDRYLAVVHPLTSIRYRKPRNAVYVCLVLWLVCAVIMTPYWLYAGTGASHSHPNRTSRCQLYWPNKSHFEHQWFWVNFELVVGFALPIVVMVLCYSKLLYGLIRGSGPSGLSLPDRARKPIRKVTAMVFTVTIVFIVCWTPYHLIRYLSAQKQWNYVTTGTRPPATEVVKFIVFNTVAQALVFVSSCCNPFIYCISSRNFRKLVPSYSIPVHSVPFHSALFRSTLFHSIPCLSVPFRSVPFRSVPFYSILFHSLPFSSVPFCSILFHSFTFWSVSLRSVPFHSVPFRSSLFHSFHSALFHSVLFRSILFHSLPFCSV